MKLQHRRLFFAVLVLAVSLMCLPAICRAQLLPPGDFQGRSLDEWTIDWSRWSIATGLGGQTLPDTVDGVKYLPPNFGGGDFVANLTIPQGTPLMVAPFFLFGERYDNETEDNPNDPVIDQIFDETTMRVTLDGNVLLEGAASDFPDRLSEVTVFSHRSLTLNRNRVVQGLTPLRRSSAWELVRFTTTCRSVNIR